MIEIYWIGYVAFIIYGISTSESQKSGASEGEGIGLILGLLFYGFIWPIMWPYLLLSKKKK